jgi:predicted MFS family arabinose efflux permease
VKDKPVATPLSPEETITDIKKDPVANHETIAGVKEKFTSYQKFVIVILALLNFTIILDFMILSPLGDILMKSLSMNTAQFGSVVSAYAISAGISGFLAAGFADKFDRKKILMFFYVGFVLGTVFCGIANSYETLFAARVVTGIFGGVIGSISMAILTDIFSIQQRGQVMGFVQMAFAGSQILGIPIGLFLAEKFNWHITFFMVVGLAMIVGLMIVFRLKPLTEHLKLQNSANPLLHLWRTIKKKDYRIGFLATMLLSMGGFMLMPFTSAFLVNNVDIPQKDLPIIFLCTGFASILIMPIIGKLSDKIDKFKLFSVGSLIAIVMVIIYTNLSPVPIWQVIIINMILFMGIMSRMVPAVALNSAVPGPADRGAYMSVNSSLQQMAGGLAAIFAGLVVYQPTKTSPIQHFDILGYVMAGLILLCLFFVYRVSALIKSRATK